MPIYDYRCLDCGKTSELLVKHSSVPNCPACGGTNLEKLVCLPAPPAQTPSMVSRARAKAGQEGHFSHYGASEKPRS